MIFSTSSGLIGFAGHQVQHAVDRAMRAVAGGVFLDPQALGQDRPVCPSIRFAGAVLGALRRNGVQEALRVLQRVGIGGETGLGQTRRHDAGVRCLPGVERFRHGAEIRHQAGALRGAQRDRLRRLVRIQPAQRWHTPPRRRPRHTGRWGASPFCAAARCRGGTAPPRSRSRRHRRRSCRRRTIPAFRPRPGSRVPAPCWDGRAAPTSS